MKHCILHLGLASVLLESTELSQCTLTNHFDLRWEEGGTQVVKHYFSIYVLQLVGKKLSDCLQSLLHNSRKYKLDQDRLNLWIEFSKIELFIKYLVLQTELRRYLNDEWHLMQSSKCQKICAGKISVRKFCRKKCVNHYKRKRHIKCYILLIFDHSQLKPGAKKLKVFQILL